jgi:hypothetical protein
MEPSKKQLALRHVIDGQRIVARQRERVGMLARNGCDTTEATRTLDVFAGTLNIFDDNLRKILAYEKKVRALRAALCRAWLSDFFQATVESSAQLRHKCGGEPTDFSVMMKRAPCLR